MKKILLLIIIIGAVYFGYNYLNQQRQEQNLQNQNESQELQENTELLEELAEVENPQDYSVPENAYLLDVENSSIVWTGVKPGGDHTGTIAFERGYLTEDYTGQFVVKMGSITTEIDGLNSHLKSQDFFDVVNFPEARFEMSAYEDGVLKGNLVILGISRAVEIPAEVSLTPDQAVIEARYTLDRTSFGINIRSGSFFENLGDRLIGDEVDLEIVVVVER